MCPARAEISTLADYAVVQLHSAHIVWSSMAHVTQFQ